MLSRLNLHAYQELAVKTIKDKKRCALLLDMGLGKTISTLTAIADLLSENKVKRVLIIAPLRVANTVWKQEAANWEHTQHLIINIATGSPSQRIKAIHTPSDVVVINRENIPWLVSNSKRWSFDYIVIDESSSFKSAKSQRFKALKRTLPATNYITLLTGTPTPNGLLDLWPQMYLIDQGQSLGKTMTAYKSRFFDQTGYGGYTYTPKPDSQRKIEKLIAPYCLSMQASDYLDLPERIVLTEIIELSPKLLKEYKDFERELVMELDDDYIEASSAATLANKLLQYCNGAVYNENGQYHETHQLKLDAVADIIEANPQETILLAYNYKSDLERLKKRFPDAVVLDKNPDTITQWNNKKIPLLLAHPASCGHGLNLQRGGSMIVWFGLNWSLELTQQFNARLHRQGQQMPVRVVYIVVKDCLDSRVIKVLSNKNATQKQLVDSLKAVL